MTSLEQSWFRAWQNLKLQPPSGLIDQLLVAYSEPQRHYHTEQHLRECLSHFSAAIDLAVHPGEVEIALWFHDAIYELRSHNNERRSAEWAVQALSLAGAEVSVTQRVFELIMVTRHDAAPIDSDQRLLVDIDLAILGAPPERFDEYDRQVQAEYIWVPSFIYKMKRRKVLSGFLSRPSIYSMNHFRERYESQARANLAKCVS